MSGDDSHPLRAIASRESGLPEELAISKNTVTKYMESHCVPQVKVADRASEVDAYRVHIDAWLRETRK